jgi:hypothetical protein
MVGLGKENGMLQITSKQLQGIEFQCSKILAGEVCHIIEEFQKTEKNLNDNEIARLLKDLIKNKIFESGRYRQQLIEQFSNGLTYFNIEFEKPIKKL